MECVKSLTQIELYLFYEWQERLEEDGIFEEIDDI